MSMMGRSMAHGNRMASIRSFRKDRTILEHQVKPGTLARMWKFAAAYRPALTIFLVAIVLDALISSVTPLILRSIIDKGIEGHGVLSYRHGLIVKLSLLTAMLAIVSAGLSLIERRLSAAIGEGLIYDMRARVFEHVQSMPIAFFSRTQTGALVSRLNNDVIGAQQAFTDLLSNVVGNAVTLILMISVMAVLSWPITLVALLLLPIFVLPARVMGRRLGTLFQRSMQLNAELNMAMTERFNVAGAMLVKLFGRPSDEKMYFKSRAAQVRDIGIRQATYTRFFMVALATTASLATAFAYGFGGLAVLNGALGVGTVVAITAYLTRIYGPLTQMSNVNIDFMEAMISFERVFEILDLEPMITEMPNAIEIPDNSATLEFRNVDFSYPAASEVSLASLEAVAVLDATPRADVLFDVNFSVAPGTMTALVGPSGAGKTTISMLVSRLYDVTSGSILVNGVDIKEATFASLSHIVGVVAQDAHLFHDTLRANLLFADPLASDEMMMQALRDAQIADVVEALPLGLDTVVGERGYRLSGGEKQRVALARLLLKSPRVVVLDEATAHLDSESELAVQRALDSAMSSRTSLVIAHRLSTIVNADQILVIDQGRIVQRGTHEELIATGGLYQHLYETQYQGQAPR